MNTQDWQTVKQIFGEVLALTPTERAAYLDRTCSSDEELRSQVERLLASYDSDFLENNIVNSAELLIQTALTAGQAIGRYRIREQIGTGGMGQVFLADDTELDRPVAFKVLHRDVAEDQERVRRFIQEARAASALNHPNILTIHEIGSFEGARFIVSEYVDGLTLREHMHQGLTAAESIDITCQIAAALQAAHSAGIVHRDIKPENVMLRKDGLVKVLDFGLAKLTEADDLPIDPKAPFTSRIHTSPGLVMGTVAYMSPEQARGQAVDARTDLWSVGVVFQEMLTGRPPFEGESVTDLITSILKPGSGPANMDSVPPDLRPICEKALAKDKDSRYRSAHDLLKDLKGEKKKMEYAIEPMPYVSFPGRTDELKTQLIRRRPTLSAEYIVTGLERHKYATLVAIVLVLSSAIGLSVYKFKGATPPSSAERLALIDASTTEKDLKFSRLPISGQANGVVISPDGRYVAYRSATGINVMELATSAEKEILRDPKIWDIRFSPDGKFLYYSFGGANSTDGFMRIPVEGGTPVKVVNNPNEGMTFSPDGSTMVFTRELTGGGGSIVFAGLDGSKERTIASFPDNAVVGIPVFSPDGKTVGCAMRYKDGGGGFLKIVGVSAADGKLRTISELKWNNFFGAVWLSNGNLVISANVNISDPSQLWSISPTGEARAITSGLVSYRELSATRNGDVLVTMQFSNTRDLWLLPNNDQSKARQLTTSGEFVGKFSWMPDGRILTSSEIGGARDIWVMNADGSSRRQLTHDQGANMQPEISFDGKYIALVSDRVGGANHIFLMDSDGNNVRQLTTGANDQLPCFSADGKWIYYIDAKDDPWKIVRRVPVSGGESSVFATAPEGWSLNGIEANRVDGRLLYGLGRFTDQWKYKIGIVPATGGAPKIIDLPANFTSIRPHWKPDNRRIAVRSMDGGPGRTIDIWTVSVDGNGKPVRLTDFRTPSTNYFTWTRDGKQLLVSRGMVKFDPILIRRSGN